MLNKLKHKHGEGYIDICVGVVVFVMVLVIAINIFSFISLRVELDQIADDLISRATYAGAFDSDFYNRCNALSNQFSYFDVETGADQYFNAPCGRVQLGDVMRVRVITDTYIKGLGVFKIPVRLSVTKSGLSEKYWK